MKFVVSSLPYYQETCQLWLVCGCVDEELCPRYWDKYKVSSDSNPHECKLLIEIDSIKEEKNG